MSTKTVLIISTAAVKLLYYDQYRKCLHKRCKWESFSLKQLTKKKIEEMVQLYKESISCIVIMLPAKNTLLYQLPVVVYKTVISFVPYTHIKDVGQWFAGLQSYSAKGNPSIITTMQKPFYIKWAKRFYHALKKQADTEKKILYKPPESTTKNELGGLFAKGFQFCIYSGHGRSRGWSGYRGFRWQDLETSKLVKPSGVVLSLSCSAFKQERNHVPFAIQWVLSGRLGSFCGFSSAVHIQPLIVLSNYILDYFEQHKTATLYTLLIYLQKAIEKNGDAAVLKEWQAFKVVGNPYVKLW
jgi:Peptidase family C25